MNYLIGTDEAGYGPNLGPLVVTGTLWQVPDVQADLYHLLSKVIGSKRSPDHITVCDSKSLYKSSGTIEALERSVLSLIESQTGSKAIDWRNLVKRLGCGRKKSETEPWLIGARLPLPLLANSEETKKLYQQFQTVCDSAGVKLLGVKTTTLFPKEFNQAIEEQGNKATVLSTTTLNIVSELVDQATKQHPNSERNQIRIVCDKHGGRSKYAGIIQHCLTTQPVKIHQESLEASQYTWTTDDSDVQIEFNARGEGALPVALSSMVSKYVREIYMKLWNRFWMNHLPNIKPTKGYPQDAKRFMAEIQSCCQKLKIEKEAIWRSR